MNEHSIIGHDLYAMAVPTGDGRFIAEIGRREPPARVQVADDNGDPVLYEDFQEAEAVAHEAFESMREAGALIGFYPELQAE